MKTKNLLFQLSDLESHLNDFSSEKLTTDEAFHLKISFQHFKKSLLEMVFLSGENINDANREQKRTTEAKTNEFEDAFPELDLKTYEAIIEHHKSYGNVLKELEIDTIMDKKDILILSGKANKNKDTEAKIDLRLVLDECMGEMSLLRELITLFIGNCLEFMGAAKIHLRTEDFEQLDLAAHKIKAGLAMMRTDDLLDIVIQIQKGCKLDQDPKHLEFLCKCFNEEFPKVKKALDNAYVELTNN
ncbi:Hpt domain-containing protein [Zobellia amurskyensis]|uniref:Hpt domain-containing protein n=1 Tax=Zobellia amurskyensis TaxID=248905 RepID=A0A7X2ZUU9_9FLAO|nr:Hpt domain-containing protein [Zobellia amurskyensis]MUH36807.1 Hpt domain-containing protein [Zobellia amurskyensis]